MSWSKRGSRRYYIRKVRRGDRFVTVYIGHGPTAEAIAALDAEAAAARRGIVAVHAAQVALADAIDAQAELVRALVEALAEASLLASGHHFDDHHEWKRLRGK